MKEIVVEKEKGVLKYTDYEEGESEYHEKDDCNNKTVFLNCCYKRVERDMAKLCDFCGYICTKCEIWHQNMVKNGHIKPNIKKTILLTVKDLNDIEAKNRGQLIDLKQRQSRRRKLRRERTVSNNVFSRKKKK